MDEIIKTTVAVISGGALWEGFKFFYPEVKQKFNSIQRAREVFYSNLDPILKSCDELFGKILSLSNEDFATFINEKKSISGDATHNKIYFYYLLGQFWASLEFIRRKSQYSSLAKMKKGKQLLRFIETCESRNYRLMDRSIQRIIGEALLVETGNKLNIMTLFDFTRNIQNPELAIGKWVLKVDAVISEVSDKEVRQRILRYGIIAAALIDHFDNNYRIVRKRNIYLNKLNEKSKNIIKRDLVGHYLTFLKNKERYYLKK